MASKSTLDVTVVLQVTPGDILEERWRIESLLGQGAMGSVFRGTDLKTKQPIAIKILSPQHSRKAKVLARFAREGKSLTTLKHRNLVQLYASGQRGALPYLVMEFLDGANLAHLMRVNGGPLPLGHVAYLVRYASLGLQFLHTQGLVHRDVKPANVVVGRDARVTVLDLGVVRDTSESDLTRPGALLGTPYYMSPEQIQGAKSLDARSDQYALAAMTFEFCTGRPPFLGQNNFEVMFAHKNTSVPDAHEFNAGVPEVVSKVLRRGLAKRPSSRYATCVEFAEAFRDALDIKQTSKATLAELKALVNRALSTDEAPMANSVDVESVRTLTED